MDYLVARTVDFPDVIIAVIDETLAFGSLKAISPEEPRHALILAIARDIEAGQSDVELQHWRDLILSTQVQFKRVDSDDDVFWQATVMRETIGIQYEVMYFSAVPAIVIKVGNDW